MFFQTLRRFSFKPVSPLRFTDKKLLLAANNDIRSINYVINGLAIGLPLSMAYRIIKNFSGMGWFNFFFSSIALVMTSNLAKAWLKLTPHIVEKIWVLDDGKQLKLKSYGLAKNEYTVRISDILNPEDNLHAKMKMQYFSAWIIETKTGNMFYMIPNTQIYEREVLKEILKGNEIDLSGKEEDENFIDI